MKAIDHCAACDCEIGYIQALNIVLEKCPEIFLLPTGTGCNSEMTFSCKDSGFELVLRRKTAFPVTLVVGSTINAPLTVSAGSIPLAVTAAGMTEWPPKKQETLDSPSWQI